VAVRFSVGLAVMGNSSFQAGSVDIGSANGQAAADNTNPLTASIIFTNTTCASPYTMLQFNSIV
jgi:hypothetical protein